MNQNKIEKKKTNKKKCTKAKQIMNELILRINWSAAWILPCSTNIIQWKKKKTKEKKLQKNFDLFIPLVRYWKDQIHFSNDVFLFVCFDYFFSWFSTCHITKHSTKEKFITPKCMGQFFICRFNNASDHISCWQPINIKSNLWVDGAKCTLFQRQRWLQ